MKHPQIDARYSLYQSQWTTEDKSTEDAKGFARAFTAPWGEFYFTRQQSNNKKITYYDQLVLLVKLKINIVIDLLGPNYI